MVRRLFFCVGLAFLLDCKVVKRAVELQLLHILFILDLHVPRNLREDDRFFVCRRDSSKL